MISFGENFKFLRKKVNLTQMQLAEHLQISHQSISKWENNISLPTCDLLIPIIKLLNCSLDDLFQVEES